VAGNVGVAFNGLVNGAHETFIFPDFPEQAGFCKTARKPYDLAVTAALIILKHHLREMITIGSDEVTAHFRPAMNLCQEILGYGEEFRLDWTLRGAGDLSRIRFEDSWPVTLTLPPWKREVSFREVKDMSRFVAFRLKRTASASVAGDDLQKLVESFQNPERFSEDDDLYILDSEHDGAIVASWDFEKQEWNVHLPASEEVTVKLVISESDDMEIELGFTFGRCSSASGSLPRPLRRPFAFFLGSDNKPYCLSTNSSIDPANPDAFKEAVADRKEEGRNPPDDLAATGFYTPGKSRRTGRACGLGGGVIRLRGVPSPRPPEVSEQ